MNTKSVVACLPWAAKKSARRKAFQSTHLSVEPLEARMLLSADGFSPAQLQSISVGQELPYGIDRIVADMGVESGSRPEVIITGGDAGQIQSLLSCSPRHESALVLKGLAFFAWEA